MRLSEYIERHHAGSLTAFAAVIGVSTQAVSRYVRDRIPSPDVMKRIVVETQGQVTPNDFYAPGLSLEESAA